MPHGQRIRCVGFLSEDGRWARCSREEYAESLSLDESTTPATYLHHLDGDCRCGTSHSSALPVSLTGTKGTSSRRIVATYDYTDEECSFLFQTVRWEPKDFSQRQPDGNDGWKWNLRGVRRVLYRLPELIASGSAQPVFLVEGEKDADRLWDQGLVATSNPMGAKKWLPEYSGFLKDRHAVTIQDNDSDGVAHVEKVAQSLYGQSRSIRAVKLNGLLKGGDVSDWLDAGHTTEELLELARHTPEWEPTETDGTEDGPNVSGPRVVRLSDVESESVSWLWKGYIPYGKVTLIAGDPGLGKSWSTLDLAARLTVGGETPDRQHTMDQGAVVLLTAEDGIADTVRPRIDVQGGDASLVHILEGVFEPDGTERLPSLIEDVGTLEQVVIEANARLIIIDPLNAYIGRTDSHNDAQIRRALTPLSKMAERTGAAVVVVMHLNQATLQPALYRVQGTIGYVGAARSVLLVVADKEEPGRRLLVPIKANLAAEMPAIAFTITQEPALAWQGVVDVDIADLLSAIPWKQSKLEEAKDFLNETLGYGGVPSDEIDVASSKRGISQATLRRAKTAIGVLAIHIGEQGPNGEGYWECRLPSDQDDQDSLCDGNERLAKSHANKALIVTEPLGTNSIKALITNPQKNMTALMDGVEQDEHLANSGADHDGRLASDGVDDEVRV